MSIGRKVQKVLAVIAVGIFAAMALYFMLVAGFSTTHIMNDTSEKSMLVADSVWVNALVALVFGAVCFLLCTRVPFFKKFISRMNEDPACAKRARLILVCVYFLICLAFVLCARQGADADQGEVCTAATEWHWQEYNSLEEGGYIHKYPNQIGIISLFYWLFGIVGNTNYTAIQILNVLFLAITAWKIGKIADACGKGEATGFFWMLGFVLFLPLVLYTTFVYGTVAGLCFAVCAAEEGVKGIQNDKISPRASLGRNDKESSGEKTEKAIDAGRKGKEETREWKRWIHLVLCLVFALLAIWCKQNYMILAIGLGITALVWYRAKWRHLLCLAVGSALVVVGSMPLISAVAKGITGQEMPRGIAQIAWVEMGLQENKALYDGWWNTYNVRTFEEAEYDREEQEKIVRKDLDETLERFRQDPGYAVSFFAGKNASQWNNPDFQGWWINQAYSSLGSQPIWMKWFLTPGAQDGFVTVLNWAQFICLLGCLMYVFFRKEKDFYCLWAMICYIGGVLFHSVWEAKAQYALVYFVLLIPVAVSGFGAVFARLDAVLREKKNKIKAARGLLGFVCALLLLFGIVQLSCSGTKVQALFIDNEHTERYQQYLAEHVNDELEDEY